MWPACACLASSAHTESLSLVDKAFVKYHRALVNSSPVMPWIAEIGTPCCGMWVRRLTAGCAPGDSSLRSQGPLSYTQVWKNPTVSALFSNR